ncbi:hypothetical protein TIFTF001_032714 [Ficus carica]|uniref:Uncharacterized protein n=1 Tax=Ficus carica TaxID=3494 RepID=A0AA88DZ02_FICCA|nr:hypothetical protein TIFTF001_032714 [Ficus carica]
MASSTTHGASSILRRVHQGTQAAFPLSLDALRSYPFRTSPIPTLDKPIVELGIFRPKWPKFVPYIFGGPTTTVSLRNRHGRPTNHDGFSRKPSWKITLPRRFLCTTVVGRRRVILLMIDDMSRGASGQWVHGTLPEGNGIWRKGRSEVKGIFRREAPEHTATYSGGAAVTIHVIFGPEIHSKDDNNTLFVDKRLTCIQRLHQGCCRRKKHTLLCGGQKHLPLASINFLWTREVHNDLKESWV